MVKGIKVLSTSTSDSSGGAARAAYRIHQAVLGLGIDSQMLVKYKGTNDSTVLAINSFLPNSSFYKALNWCQNKVKNKWQHYLWSKYPDRSDIYLSDLRSMDIGHALEKLDYDILHLHWVNFRFLPLEQLPKDRPIIWTLHDSWPFTGICHLPFVCHRYQLHCGHCPSLCSVKETDLSFCIWKRKKEIYSKLDLHIVAPSRWIANCAYSSSLLGSYDIHVIPNCIDTEQFCPGERFAACVKLGLNPYKRHLLYGAMNAIDDPNKGFHQLKEAIQFLAPKLAPDTDLVIFGSKNFSCDEMFGMKVINLGVLKDTSRLVDTYRAANVTVVPSLCENLSCTIMESLSCGTPVVAFNIGGNEDMINDKENGFLAENSNSQDLSEGIIWCLENNKDGFLSKQARETVLNRFSPEIVGENYAALYSSLRR